MGLKTLFEGLPGAEVQHGVAPLPPVPLPAPAPPCNLPLSASTAISRDNFESWDETAKGGTLFLRTKLSAGMQLLFGAVPFTARAPEQWPFPGRDAACLHWQGMVSKINHGERCQGQV